MYKLYMNMNMNMNSVYLICDSKCSCTREEIFPFELCIFRLIVGIRLVPYERK